MSTLTLSIVALVVFVVGAVLLFNLWQARGSRRLARSGNRFTGAFEPPAPPGTRGGAARDAAAREPAGTAAAGDSRHHADHTAWTRERREPTLVPEDEPIPATRRTRDGSAAAAGFTASGAAGRDEERGWYAPGDDHGRESDRYPVDDGVIVEDDRLPDPDEDLGPPQFEDPRLDPVLEALIPDPPAAAAPHTPPHVTPHLSPKTTPGNAAGSTSGGAPAGRRQDAAAAAPEEEPADVPLPPYVPAAIDHVVTLVPRAPVNAERLIALTSSLRHVGSKAIRIEADGGMGRWVPLQSGVMVRRLRCSLLLANRQGPLNPVELSDFSAAMESVARRIGATYAAADMNQVLRRARELDAVAARLDTQVDLGVEASAPITPQKLASVARQMGLSDKAGRHASFADGGDLLFTLAPGETADLLAFVLDVPRTAEEHEAWPRMVACASSCAKLTGGRVVDSAGRGMSVAMIENVGQQIQKRYQELADAGLKAGSPAALRVFN